MENLEYRKIECGDCGGKLSEESLQPGYEGVCSKCGSTKKHISLGFHDHFSTAEIKESIAGKLKDSNYSSNRRIRYEFFEGDDYSISLRKWMKKTRVIDKRNNQYFEKVTDPDTGNDIHYCEEPLTDHFGHGKAKFMKEE